MTRWMNILLCTLLPVWAVAEEVSPVESSAIKVAAVDPVHIPATHKAAGHEIGAYKAKYEVLYGGLKVGEMTQKLSIRQNGEKSLKTVAYTTGVASWLKSDKVVEQSVWHHKAGDVLPQSYTYRYNGQSKRVFERLGFDWKAGTVSSLRDGAVTQLPAERGTLDKHMVQIVMREDLLNGLIQHSYTVADRSKIREYKIEVQGEEFLMTDDFGKLKCVKVKKGTTLFWLAEKFDYLPVKVEKEEDGSLASSHLIAYRPG